jgi:chromosome segregation ATPase
MAGKFAFFSHDPQHIQVPEADPLSIFPADEQPLEKTPEQVPAPPRWGSMDPDTSDLRRHAIATNVAEADRVNEVLRSLEARIAKLTSHDQPLAAAGPTVDRLEQRAAELADRLDTTANAIAAHTNRLAAGDAELVRVGQLASALEARIAQVTADNQPLALGEAKAARLERRVEEASTRLEEMTTATAAESERLAAGTIEASRVGELISALEARIANATDQPLAFGEMKAARLEERIAQASTRLEQTTNAVASQTERIAAGVAGTSHLEALVAALEERIAKLSAADQPLALSDSKTARLDRCIAAATMRLEQTENAFAVQSGRMVASVAEVDRVSGLVSALETRIAKLSDKEHALAPPTGLVGRLEQRVAETTASLDQAVKTKADLDRQIAKLKSELARVSAAVREQTTRVRRLDPSRPAAALRDRLAGRITMTSPLHRWQWAVGLALVLMFASLGFMTFGSHSVLPNTSDTRATGAPGGDSLQAVLPSRPLTFVVSAPRAPATARLPRAAGTSGGRKTTAAPQKRDVVAATAPVPPVAFVGVLVVDSNPGGAAVFVDRRYVGDTPLHLDGVRAGSHTIWVEHAGHPRWTASVRVAADRETQVNVNLQQDRER